MAAVIGWAANSFAQRYEVERGRVYFGNELIVHADSRSFVDLGMGYAKDQNNVYVNGRILENVDPSGFRLKVRSGRRGHERNDEEMVAHRGYFKTNMNVYYGNRKLNAMASSFEDLGGGYAKDSFDVYYCGEKVKGAMASSFKYMGGGYGQDSFDVYYRGQKIK
ncbi:MAG: DKNYY domain-containing protein [Bacteroidaceae bacterium]|nr:DKNYY domain-containing protein [Bacteroidaceae bacterium]